jgi:alkyldihydroxyacetonephosphate synthase
MSGRQLSHWAWGYVDKFPSRQERLAMAAQLQLVLGFGAGMPKNPAPLQQVDLPAPRVVVPPRLASIASSEPEDRIRHTYGRSYRDVVRGFGGDFTPAPDVVAHPASEDDIAEIFAWASGSGVAVIPYGGGTSVVGGVEGDVGGAFNGVVALDLKRLDRVVEVDPVSRAARIQAGATGPVLERQLAEHGLTLRHFPQSFELSTLGGWIATRAGGHFATVYTHIDDLVESIRLLTPIGVSESRRLPGSGAGPSPDRLVMGSEGILGVVTEAWMRVQARVRFRSQATVFFNDFESAVLATRTIAQSGLHPANCRLLDRREALLHRVTTNGRRCVLILAFESADVPVRERLETALRLAQEAGGRCEQGPRHRQAGEGKEDDGKGAADTWRQAFFDAPYLQASLVSLGVVADTFETSCTWDRFPGLHQAVVHEVRGAMKRVCGKGFLSCRFTHVYPDGPAPYYTFLAPGKRGGELEQWAEIKSAASEALLRFGGTITHHHSVGRDHRPWYDRQRPDGFARALAATKAELDPAGILNPGVLIDPC